MIGNSEPKKADTVNQGSAQDKSGDSKEGLDKKSQAGVDNERAPGNEAPAGEPETETGAGTDMEQLKEELEKVRQEAADEHERLLRLSAEFENYKKRIDRQSDEFKKYANESLIKELLTVVDNLERAIYSTEGDKSVNSDSCVVEGVEMTLNEILKILKKFNVTPIEARGKPFDPVYHEAMMQEASDEYPENTVINELQKGYMIHDRLLRPAMVVVSKSKSKSDS